MHEQIVTVAKVQANRLVAKNVKNSGSWTIAIYTAFDINFRL